MIKKNYNHKVDIWSAGVIYYILVTGEPPFNGMSRAPNGQMGLDSNKIKQKILKGKADFSLKEFDNFDPRVKEVIQAMLTYDPAQRPEASDLLKHSYFLEKIDEKQQKEGNFRLNYFLCVV